jgi:hypothetical protein
MAASGHSDIHMARCPDVSIPAAAPPCHEDGPASCDAVFPGGLRFGPPASASAPTATTAAPPNIQNGDLTPTNEHQPSSKGQQIHNNESEDVQTDADSGVDVSNHQQSFPTPNGSRLLTPSLPSSSKTMPSIEKSIPNRVPLKKRKNFRFPTNSGGSHD